MPTRVNERELAARLEAQEVLKLRGFSATALEEGGVLIERWGHARGLWICHSNGFSWTPAGYNESICRVDDVDGAVRYTLITFDSLK